MTRILLSALFTVLMTVSALAETRMVNSPGDGFLNLRTGPGAGFDVVRQMDHGSLVDVLETKGKWSRVYHQVSGAQGWAFTKYLLREQTGMPVRWINSPGDGYLNLRSGPGSDFRILRQMYHGERVDILERKGNWVRVYHHPTGARGWAYAKYLRR